MIPDFTVAKAREWARRAELNGDRAKAAAWSKYADELQAQERPIIDGKMRAAGE